MTEPFNALSPAQAERLAYLLEELGEAQQAIGKILRHGYTTFDPRRPGSSNRQDLERELSDVAKAVQKLLDAEDLIVSRYQEFLARKDHPRKYFHHQEPVK